MVAITTQQISLRAAAAIRANFVERFGVRHEHAWEFPTRERTRRVRPSQFTVLGFSRAKAEYVLELAHSDLDLTELSMRSDSEVIEALTAVRGLGRWTADWFLARHLARSPCVARRRPGRAQGSLDLLRCRSSLVHRGGSGNG